MISVIVTSRVEGNINHNMNELVRSLAENSRHPEDIELLIKYDDNDPAAQDEICALQAKLLPFQIKTCFGRRGRGYTDIHHGYNQLLPMLSLKSKIVIAMADDFRAERDWDNALRNAAIGSGEYFIIHQRPHPVPREEFLKIKDRPEKWRLFNMDTNMFCGEDLYVIDEAPAWSTKLLELCAMRHIDRFHIEDEEGKEHSGPWAFNGTFPVSFTDAWTLCLEYTLWVNYQINITRFLPTIFVSRKTCEVDQPGNARWHTDRKNNFDYIKSEGFIDIVSTQAKEIACLVNQKQQV